MTPDRFAFANTQITPYSSPGSLLLAFILPPEKTAARQAGKPWRAAEKAY